MFGQNKVEKQEWGDGTTLDVVEVFPTIQGEGPDVGTPAVFVRLRGCNLRCYWCDTQFEEGKRHEVEDVVAMVERARGDNLIRLAVLTGGEPFRQNFIPFVEMLVRLGWSVQIETAATVGVPPAWKLRFDLLLKQPRAYRTSVIVSPKTPRINLELAIAARAFKYIVRAGELSEFDGLPICNTQRIGGQVAPLARPPSLTLSERVWLQPCDEGDPLINRKNVEAAVWSAQRFGYRVSLQQHKLMGLP